MVKKKVHFLGLLANVDSSILDVKFEHGFEIRAIPLDESVMLISAFAGLTKAETFHALSSRTRCLHPTEKKCFGLSNLLEKLPEFDHNLVHGYVFPTLRLMRLFKEGNIFMPLSYYYYLENSAPHLVRGRRSHLHISPVLYHVEPDEISDLDYFIRNTKLPFVEDFLNLALENFDLSYHTLDMNLSFLSLMTSLEALLNPGESEVTYRISRNVAVLLGRSKKESQTIFREVKKLYEKRSRILHAGKRVTEQADVLKLRTYVRDSIKQIHQIGRSKTDVLDLLNSLGYGQRSTISF